MQTERAGDWSRWLAGELDSLEVVWRPPFPAGALVADERWKIAMPDREVEMREEKWGLDWERVSDSVRNRQRTDRTLARMGVEIMSLFPCYLRDLFGRGRSDHG